MSKVMILPIGAGVIGQDDVPLVRIMDSDETPTTITVYGVVDTVQPVTGVTWTVNGVEQTGDVSRSPVLELTNLQPETSYAITFRATNINGESQASARTIWTKKITTITPSDVIDGVSYYDYQDVYRTGTMPERDETDITVSGRDVTVPAGHYAESETVSVSSDYIIPAGTKNINTNGTEDVTQYANVNVSVPASAVVSGTKNITNNGTEDVTNYASVDVQVPASAVDTGTKQITTNGTNQDVIGYAAVDVNVQPSLYTPSNVTPTTSQQTITAPTGYYGLDSVTVDGVTSAIDANIQAGNIKDGVTILGVTGTFDPTPNLGTLQVTPSTNAQVILPSNVDGWDEVDVSAVTSSIDNNITAGNIRRGVSILGVQGTVDTGITPTGTLNIVNNGTYDITNYANVTVQVASGDFNELCFTALSANSTVEMSHNGSNATTTKPVMYYSTDGRQTWTLWDYSAITLANVGDKVYFYGNNYEGFSRGSNTYSKFGGRGNVSVSGNIMSLISRYGDRDIPCSYCFAYLFDSDGGYLLDAQNLVLPSMTTPHCYKAMFRAANGGNTITVAPNLPAEVLEEQCYYQMFSYCRSLTTVQSFNAKTLNGNSCCTSMFSWCNNLVTIPDILEPTRLTPQCYKGMFDNCSQIIKTPVLPAKDTSANQCYYEMFNGCTSLNEVTTFALDLNQSNWLNNVAASGTFYKIKGANIPVDSPNGIPTGWTVVEIPSVIDDNEEITFDAVSGTTIYYTTDGTTPTTGSTLYSGPIDARSIGDKFTLKYLSVYNNTEFPIMEYTYYYAFYVEALENGTVLNTYNWRNGMVYSTDKQLWKACSTISNNQLTLTSTGDKAYFKRASVDGVQVNVGNLTTVSGTIKVGGYIEFVATGDITNNAILTYKVGNMFENCTGLVDASDLVLINNMTGYDTGYSSNNGAYLNMFKGCTNLTKAPNLPSQQLNHYCYQCMFQNCTSLIEAPDLPATALNNLRQCYYQMFYGCTSLVTSGQMAFTQMSVSSGSFRCCCEMFRGCTNLSSVFIGSCTDWYTDYASNWLYGVAANGVVIVPNSNTQIPSNSVNGVPTGWVRVAPKTTPNAYDVKMTRNSLWVVLQNEWPNDNVSYELGDAKASDGGDFVGSDNIEVYLRNGYLDYDDNWTNYQNPYGQFYRGLSHNFANGTGLYLEFEMDSGYEIDFDYSFEDCSDWQTKGYSDFEDCNCTENNLDCPPQP